MLCVVVALLEMLGEVGAVVVLVALSVIVVFVVGGHVQG